MSARQFHQRNQIFCGNHVDYFHRNFKTGYPAYGWNGLWIPQADAQTWLFVALRFQFNYEWSLSVYIFYNVVLYERIKITAKGSHLTTREVIRKGEQRGTGCHAQFNPAMLVSFGDCCNHPFFSQNRIPEIGRSVYARSCAHFGYDLSPDTLEAYIDSILWAVITHKVIDIHPPYWFRTTERNANFWYTVRDCQLSNTQAVLQLLAYSVPQLMLPWKKHSISPIHDGSFIILQNAPMYPTLRPINSLKKLLVCVVRRMIMWQSWVCVKLGIMVGHDLGSHVLRKKYPETISWHTILDSETAAWTPVRAVMTTTSLPNNLFACVFPTLCAQTTALSKDGFDDEDITMGIHTHFDFSPNNTCIIRHDFTSRY